MLEESLQILFSNSSFPFGTLLGFPNPVPDFVWVEFSVVGWHFVLRNKLCTLGGRPPCFAVVLSAKEGKGWVALWSVVFQGSADWH